MPFKSKSQQRFLYAKHPKVAKEFARHTPKGASLPERAPADRKVAAASLSRRRRGR